MTDDTIHFTDTSRLALEDTERAMGRVTSPILTAQEARILLDHLDHVQAASLLGDRWTVWCQAKGKLVSIEYDGSKA